MKKWVNAGLALLLGLGLMAGVLVACAPEPDEPQPRGTQHFGAVSVASTLNTDGVVTFNDTLDVDGATTLNYTLDVDGEISSGTGPVQIDDDTLITGTVDVSGITSLESSLDVDGATTLNDTLDVDGEISSGTGDVQINDDVTITGTLDVSGDADFSEDLEVGDDLTVGGDFYVTGHSWITTTTTITGDTTIEGDLDVTGNLSVTGNMTISGTQVYTGNVTVTGDVDVTGDLDVSGNIDSSTGCVTVTDCLYVTGTLEVDDDVEMGSNIADYIYLRGHLRSWDGTDYWEDIAVSDIPGNNNGWQASYNVTDWDSETAMTAMFGEVKVTTDTHDCEAYGLDGMARMHGIVADGTSTGIGVFGEVLATDTASWPYAYAVYGQLETGDGGGDVITDSSVFYADLAGNGTFGTVDVLSVKAGDTYDYGIDFEPAAMSVADFRMQYGEMLDNITDGWIKATGNVTVAGNLAVTGTSDLQGDVSDSGGTFTIDDDAQVTDDFTMGGDASTHAYFYSLVETTDGVDVYADITADQPNNHTGWWVGYNLTDWAGQDDITAHGSYMQVSDALTQTGTFVGAKGTALVAAGLTLTESYQTEGIGVWGAAWVDAGGSLPYGYGFYSHLKVCEEGTSIITGTNYMAGQNLSVCGETNGVITTSYIMWTEPDTWTVGINFADVASFTTADFVLSNGESIDNLVDGVIRMTGNVTVTGVLEVDGNTDLQGEVFSSVGCISVTDCMTVSETLDVTKGLDVGGNLDVEGTLELGAAGETFGGPIKFGAATSVVSGTCVAHGFSITPTSVVATWGCCWNENTAAPPSVLAIGTITETCFTVCITPTNSCETIYWFAGLTQP